MRTVIDLREPTTELPPFEFTLTDADRANAKVDMAIIRAHRNALNERDQGRTHATHA